MAQHVLIVVQNLPVPFDRRVWMEATTLRSAGYDVTVICPATPNHPAGSFEIDGIEVHRHPLDADHESYVGFLREYAESTYHELRLAWKVWRRHRFDAIHICNPPDLLFLTALPARVLGRVRVVFDQHDVNPELFESKFERRGLFYWALRLAERLTYATAHVVISTNESYRSIALARGGKAPDDVFVVRSGPRMSDFGRPVEPAPRDPRFSSVVGYLGVMGPQEGIDHLLRAAALLRSRGREDIGYVLIGGGASLDDMRALSVELGIDDIVEFTGRVPDDELKARITSCDICVNPDPMNPLNDISTMNKILEYMALGRPIVQYDLREGRHSAGDASLYARPNDITDLADTIERLLSDPTTREQLGETGRQRMMDELSWEHSEPVLLRAYARLFSRPSNRNRVRRRRPAETSDEISHSPRSVIDGSSTPYSGENQPSIESSLP